MGSGKTSRFLKIIEKQALLDGAGNTDTNLEALTKLLISDYEIKNSRFAAMSDVAL